MGVAKSADYEDDYDDFDSEEDFNFLEESEQPRVRRDRLAWRSVEDYLADKRLKEEVSDIFDEDWQ